MLSKYVDPISLNTHPVPETAVLTDEFAAARVMPVGSNSYGTLVCRSTPALIGINCLPLIAPVEEFSALLTFEVIKKSARTPGTRTLTVNVEGLTAVTVKLLLAKLNTSLGVIPYVALLAESERIKQIILLSMTESDIVPGEPEKAKVSVPSEVIVISPSPPETLLP